MIVQEYTSKTQVLQINRFSQTEKTSYSGVRASFRVKVVEARGIYQWNGLASDNCHISTALGQGNQLLSLPLHSLSQTPCSSSPLSCSFFSLSSLSVLS